jgi:hypothetical protein
MPSRNINTDSFMPDASPELQKLLAECKTPEEIRETLRDYYTRTGGAVYDPERNAIRFTGKQDEAAHQFSRIVTLPNGHRTLVSGARSEAELQAWIDALLKAQR